MTSPERHCTRATGFVPMLVVACVAWAGPGLSFAQAKKAAKANQGKAADVFDDEEETKDGDAKSADPTKPAAVSDRDSIGFTQENVASQMTELEDRMFRLSEATRSLEPENASRLRPGAPGDSRAKS